MINLLALALVALLLPTTTSAQLAKFGISRHLAEPQDPATPSPTPNEPDPDDPGKEFKHFVAYDSSHTCDSDSHALPFNNQIRGVNLGGWMVLEPWITPSLFYQFLGGNETAVAMDHYSFCAVLGPEEGNKQLRRHWETWVSFIQYSSAICNSCVDFVLICLIIFELHQISQVTEDIIRDLAKSGAVNSLRVPVGDFMFQPYGPYRESHQYDFLVQVNHVYPMTNIILTFYGFSVLTAGCTDGALEYVDKLLDWARAYGLSVLLDVHTQKDSQNGFDNSGQTMNFMWTSGINTWPRDLTTFQHWPIRAANWMGTFDNHAINYTDINYKNIEHSVQVIVDIVDRYHDHPAVLGLEPVNEPWELTQSSC